jgi:two-component system, cell cycle sensor histidine kinase and response regulator CckA
VKQSGGVIAVQTAPLEGSTFTLSLPRLDEPADEPGETEVTPRPAAPGKELILYAEDDEAVRSLVTMILRDNGYQVLSAASGEEALQRAVPFIGSLGLVITDVVMSGMNGRLEKPIDSKTLLATVRDILNSAATV